MSKPAGAPLRAGTIGECHNRAVGTPAAADTNQMMSTYWYASGSFVWLCLAPQFPAPGRFLGRAELTPSEFELVKRIVEQAPVPVADPGHWIH